jgi:general secretion pathway protein D
MIHAEHAAERWANFRECRPGRGGCTNMKTAPRALAALALLLAPAAAHAQDLTPKDESSPAPRKPGDLVTLSLKDVELPDLVRSMSEMTGQRFVVAAAPKSFQATIVAPQKVTVAEAYQAFLLVLSANHLTVVPRGRFFKIIDSQDAVHEAPVTTGKDGAPPEERYVTYLRRVAHVSADEVASGVLSKLASHDGAVLAYGDLLLLTDTGNNVQRLMRVLDEIDVAKPEDRVWLEPVQYVPASELKKELDEVLGASTGTKDTKDKAPAGGSPTAGSARVTRIVAVDRPNALLIVGSQGGYQRMLELIRSLDVAVPSDGQIHVVPLRYADAKKIVAPINEAVSAGSSAGAAAAAGASPAAAASKVLEAPVKVSAEETNNALLVTASAHDYAAVREVIRELDQPRRQVYIEAVVMDLSVQNSNVLEAAMHGFDSVGGSGGSTIYGGSNPLKSLLLPTTDTTSLQALVLGVRGPDIPVPAFLQSTLGTTSIPGLGFFLDAYATASDSDILSMPHVLATDNMPAELHVQLNTSLQRNAASYGAPSSSSGANPLSLYAAPATQNYGKIGPQIKVTPHIDESDDVRLDIQETISDVTNDGPSSGTLGTVNFYERGASTTLTVKDGHTAVIGGLVKNSVTHTTVKVPLLGDIPVLGALFRSSSDQMQKDNLVLILTPHIIRDEDDMRRIFEQRMQERQEFIDHYFAFKEDGPPLGFDPARGHGLLSQLRADYAQVAEQRRLEQSGEVASAAHAPKEPIDLPSASPSPALAGPAAASPVPTTPPASIAVSPPSRSIERIER